MWWQQRTRGRCVLGPGRVHTKTADCAQRRQFWGRLWDTKEDTAGRGACGDQGLGQGFGTTSAENGRRKQRGLREGGRGQAWTLGAGPRSLASGECGGPTWLRPLLTD